MKNKFKISIITVVYNGSASIENTILSVINQSYENLEYIIIDGKSTDGTVDIIKKYEDKIDYWVSESDKGIYDAMNKGIDVAKGDYLFFLGADDLLCTEIIATIFNKIKKEYLLIFGNMKYDNDLLVKSQFSYKTYLHNTIHHQASFYNKELFKNFRYDIRYKIAADYELNLIIFLLHRKNTLYVDEIISECQDDGVSRLQASQSYHEMFLIRGKYISPVKNKMFFFLLKIKAFLKVCLNK